MITTEHLLEKLEKVKQMTIVKMTLSKDGRLEKTLLNMKLALMGVFGMVVFIPLVS